LLQYLFSKSIIERKFCNKTMLSDTNLMTQHHVFITFVDNFYIHIEMTNDYSLRTQIAPACQLFHSKPTMTTPFRSIHKQKNGQDEIYEVRISHRKKLCEYVKIVCKSTLYYILIVGPCVKFFFPRFILIYGFVPLYSYAYGSIAINRSNDVNINDYNLWKFLWKVIEEN